MQTLTATWIGRQDTHCFFVFRNLFALMYTHNLFSGKVSVEMQYHATLIKGSIVLKDNTILCTVEQLTAISSSYYTECMLGLFLFFMG